jgi:hypothetical protein
VLTGVAMWFSSEARKGLELTLALWPWGWGQGERIWKLREFSVTVVESFTARSLLHYWRTLYGYVCACLVSGAFCHVD